jgi:dTDP-4-dehydrorhamnose 3,5-epimerase
MLKISTKLEGVYIMECEVFTDHRGFFTESFQKAKWEQAGITCNIVQVNRSMSTMPGTIRGLHYQLNPKAQTKIVQVISGAIYDVVVDIRKNSNTFGQWVAAILSEHNQRQIIVPKGFAHGFYTLVPNTQIIYYVDEFYSPEHERGILWDDPQIGIEWPSTKAILSEKDKILPLLKDADINFTGGV